jgi:hypothetical protein
MSGLADGLPSGHNSALSRQNKDMGVQCYSGYIYAEEPRSFVWQDRQLRVESIKGAWREPGKRLFTVVAEDGKSFELCYDEAADQWSAVKLA